jgi:hypothetical protein
VIINKLKENKIKKKSEEDEKEEGCFSRGRRSQNLKK